MVSRPLIIVRESVNCFLPIMARIVNVFLSSQGYQVYVVELVVEAGVCAKRNIHDRTLADLTKICSNWVKTPDHMINLDVRTLLQDDAIQEVEMEDAVDEPPTSSNDHDATKDEPTEGQDQGGDEDEDDNDDDQGFRKVIRSKWDGDVSETNLGKHHSMTFCYIRSLRLPATAFELER